MEIGRIVVVKSREINSRGAFWAETPFYPACHSAISASCASYGLLSVSNDVYVHVAKVFGQKLRGINQPGPSI